MATFNLTNIDNFRQGTQAADIFNSGIGDDTLFGLGGDDLINGSGGDDVLNGGTGMDTLNGGVGDDELHGGSGGFGDVINGESGDDELFGGSGRDTLDGGVGDDRLFGADDLDRLFGRDGDDELDGGAGRDLLDGGNGDDELDGDAGIDLLNGGSGDDQLEGGDGDDRSVRVTTTTTREDGTEEVVDTRTDQGGLIGGPGDDELLGGAGSDRLEGGEGDDTLKGGDGNDSSPTPPDTEPRTDEEGNVIGTIVTELQGGLFGGNGNDILDGGSGGDTLDGGQGSDVYTGGSGNDAFLWDPREVGFDTITDMVLGADRIDVLGLDMTELNRLFGGDGFISIGDPGVGGVDVPEGPGGNFREGGLLVIDFLAAGLADAGGILTIQGAHALAIGDEII